MCARGPPPRRNGRKSATRHPDPVTPFKSMIGAPSSVHIFFSLIFAAILFADGGIIFLIKSSIRVSRTARIFSNPATSHPGEKGTPPLCLGAENFPLFPSVLTQLTVPSDIEQI